MERLEVREGFKYNIEVNASKVERMGASLMRLLLGHMSFGSPSKAQGRAPQGLGHSTTSYLQPNFASPVHLCPCAVIFLARISSHHFLLSSSLYL